MHKYIKNGIEIVGSLCAAAVLGWIVLGQQAGNSSAQQSTFVGGDPQREDVTDARVARLRFVAGSRSNWHFHSGGQMLMIIEGRAVTQVRGQSLREMHAGEPWYTAAGVEHWHGAHPQEDAYQFTVSVGDTNWLEPVTDAEYLAPAQR